MSQPRKKTHLEKEALRLENFPWNRKWRHWARASFYGLEKSSGERKRRHELWSFNDQSGNNIRTVVVFWFYEGWCLILSCFSGSETRRSSTCVWRCCRTATTGGPPVPAITPSYWSHIGSADWSVSEFQVVCRALHSAALRPGAEGQRSAQIAPAAGTPPGGAARETGDHPAAPEPGRESRTGQWVEEENTHLESNIKIF